MDHKQRLRTTVVNTVVLLLLCGHIHCTGNGNGPDDTNAMADTAWPCFMQNREHMGQSEYVGSQTGRVAWSATAPSEYCGSPAIDTLGNVVVGTYVAGLYCYSPQGELVWHYPLDNYHLDPIVSAPAIASDGTIYVGIATYDTLVALNPDGTVNWNLGVGGGSAGSSPALGHDGTIYIGCNNGVLYAVNPDGTVKWSYSTNYIILSTVAIDRDGLIYLGSIDGCLHVLDPDGRVKWKFCPGGHFYSSPVLAPNGWIYCNNRTTLYALDHAGSVRWSYPFTAYARGTPALGNDGTIYMPGGDTLYAFNSDGTILWQINEVGLPASSPAIGQDGTVYIGMIWNNETFYALNPDGSVKWSKYIDTTNTSCPAIDSLGTVYVGTTSNVFYAFRDENLHTPTLHYPGMIVLILLVTALMVVNRRRKAKFR